MWQGLPKAGTESKTSLPYPHSLTSELYMHFGRGKLVLFLIAYGKCPQTFYMGPVHCSSGHWKARL